MTRLGKPDETRRRTLGVVATWVLLLVFQLVPVQRSLAAGGEPLLLLADADTAGTAALEQALQAAGYTVVRVTPEFAWNGTNPPLEGFDCVVHLNGATWHTPLPVSAQTALVDFVRNGGGFIGGQFNGYELVSGQQVDMDDLVLQLWPHPDNCSECDMTWTQVPGQEDHPVLESVPPSFTFFADAHDAGPVVNFAEYPSTVLMRSPEGGAAVIVRELENGRVVSFASAANTTTDRTLQDFNILTLYVNAANWVCSTALAPPQCGAPEVISPPDVPISFTATSNGGSGVHVEITDYDCFFINGAGKLIDRSDACRVSVDGNTITIEHSGGVGTQITWTAVASDGKGHTSEAGCGVPVVAYGQTKNRE